MRKNVRIEVKFLQMKYVRISPSTLYSCDIQMTLLIPKKNKLNALVNVAEDLTTQLKNLSGHENMKAICSISILK